jgi:uncharacterized protein (TIGR02001 family)
MLEKGCGGRDVVRWVGAGIVLSMGLLGTAPCAAADSWGGSFGVTSDYIVRGISRSNGEPALQLDLHYANTSGFIAGLFASNTRIDRDDPTDVELDAFLGYAWTAGNDWRGKVLASHYAYPWNHEGSGYDYDELDVEAAYRDWLNAALIYSPNAPRYVPYAGLIRVASKSAEVTLQRPLLAKLSATAGLGYSRYEGPDPSGYGYWSVGASCDLAPVSLTLSYVNTSAGARALFYNDAENHRFAGTVIWRFK